MEQFKTIRANLEKKGYETSAFETAAEAKEYLCTVLEGKTVGLGGATTLMDMDLLGKLQEKSTVHARVLGGSPHDAAKAQVYMCSVNGIAETGEMVNIDGTCNRISGSLFGHEKVYFVVGVNKITPDLESAIFRARNIAAPKSAFRSKTNTPCAVKGDKCYDCSSPDRICRGMMVYWGKPKSMPYEVVFINEELGF